MDLVCLDILAMRGHWSFQNKEKLKTSHEREPPLSCVYGEKDRFLLVRVRQRPYKDPIVNSRPNMAGHHEANTLF